MIYIAILTEKPPKEVESRARRIGKRISRFEEDYPDRENTFAEPEGKKQDSTLICRSRAKRASAQPDFNRERFPVWSALEKVC
jgi:hypothetical protein